MMKKLKRPPDRRGEGRSHWQKQREALQAPDSVKDKLVPRMAAGSAGFLVPISVACTLKIKRYLSFWICEELLIL